MIHERLPRGWHRLVIGGRPLVVFASGRGPEPCRHRQKDPRDCPICGDRWLTLSRRSDA